MATRRGPASAGRPLDLLVVAHVNVDRLIEVAELPDVDRTVPIVRQSTTLGGPAANVARVAAEAGLAVGVAGRIGPEFPRPFAAELDAAGVDRRGLEIVPGTTTPTCFIVHDARGRQTTLIDQGPMGSAARAKLPLRSLARAGWVHLGTGDPEYLRRIQRWVRAHGGRAAVDPAQEIHYRWSPGPFRTFVADAEILFGNRAEIARAMALTGVRRPADLTRLVPLVVETRGALGAVAYFRGGSVRVPAVGARRYSDPTGAGDAFRAGFYVGWLRGRPLAAALRSGAEASSAWLAGRAGRPRGGSPR